MGTSREGREDARDIAGAASEADNLWTREMPRSHTQWGADPRGGVRAGNLSETAGTRAESCRSLAQRGAFRLGTTAQNGAAAQRTDDGAEGDW